MKFLILFNLYEFAEFSIKNDEKIIKKCENICEINRVLIFWKNKVDIQSR